MDVIEVTDTATDTFGNELRRGDRVSLALVDGTMSGTVVEITPSSGEITSGDEGIHAKEPVQITVRFDNGESHTFGTTFLRLPCWRWVADDLKREAGYTPPLGHPQGA